MRIELADLESGKSSFTHAYAPGELLLDDNRVSLAELPSVSGSVWTKGQRVRVKGRVCGRLKVECDRCLKPVEIPVDSQFEIEYATKDDYQTEQTVELTEDDLDLAVFDGQTINIDELVIEELLLAVPDHVLCDESCKGICPICGVNKNSTECDCDTRSVDPRWAGLKKIVNSKS